MQKLFTTSFFITMFLAWWTLLSPRPVHLYPMDILRPSGYHVALNVNEGWPMFTREYVHRKHPCVCCELLVQVIKFFALLVVEFSLAPPSVLFFHSWQLHQ